MVAAALVAAVGITAVVIIRVPGEKSQTAPGEPPRSARTKGGPTPDATGAYDQKELSDYLVGRFEGDVIAVLGSPVRPPTSINQIRVMEFRCLATDPRTGKRTTVLIVILEDGRVKHLKFEDMP